MVGTGNPRKKNPGEGRQWCHVVSAALSFLPSRLGILVCLSPLPPPLRTFGIQNPKGRNEFYQYSLNFVTRYCCVLPFSQALNVHTSNRVFKMNGTYGTRDSYSCCNNIRVFQITLLTKEQAKLHVSMFPWTINSNGGICIFSLLPCG